MGNRPGLLLPAMKGLSGEPTWAVTASNERVKWEQTCTGVGVAGGAATAGARALATAVGCGRTVTGTASGLGP